jgi:hypothetical protein
MILSSELLHGKETAMLSYLTARSTLLALNNIFLTILFVAIVNTTLELGIILNSVGA